MGVSIAPFDPSSRAEEPGHSWNHPPWPVLGCIWKPVGNFDFCWALIMKKSYGLWMQLYLRKWDLSMTGGSSTFEKVKCLGAQGVQNRWCLLGTYWTTSMGVESLNQLIHLIPGGRGAAISWDNFLVHGCSCEPQIADRNPAGEHKKPRPKNREARIMGASRTQFRGLFQNLQPWPQFFGLEVSRTTKRVASGF